MNLIKARETVDNLLSDYRLAKKSCIDAHEKLIKAEDRLVYIEEAQQVAQCVAQQIQQRVHNEIAGVVSRCLEAIFYEDNYGFKILFDRKRGRTDAVLILTKDEHEIIDPLNYDSGAVCEIAALALRVSCLIMSKPHLRKLLILDEPFKALSAQYYERVRLLLDGLSEDFGIQIIMVTHNPKLQTGKVIEL